MVNLRNPEDLQLLIDQTTQNLLDLAKTTKGRVNDDEGVMLMNSGITYLACVASTLNTLTASVGRLAEALESIDNRDAMTERQLSKEELETVLALRYGKAKVVIV